MKNRTLPAQRAAVRTRRRADRDGRAAIQTQSDRSRRRLNAPPTSSPSRRSRGRSESTGGAAHVRARSVRTPTHNRSPWSPAHSARGRRRRAAGETGTSGALTSSSPRSSPAHGWPPGAQTEQGARGHTAHRRRPPRRPRRAARGHLRRDRPASTEHRRQLDRQQQPARPRQPSMSRTPITCSGATTAPTRFGPSQLPLTMIPFALSSVAQTRSHPKAVTTCTHTWCASRSGWSGDAYAPPVFAVTPASRSPSSCTWSAKMSM